MSPPRHDCVGALLVRDGAVLLGRRTGRDWLAGAWDVFGGHIERGEDPRQALARELEEELGVVATHLRFLDTLHGAAPEPWRLRLYAVTAWRGEPRNRQPDEHAELRWCGLAEARRHLRMAHPRFARVLAAALRPGGAIAAGQHRPSPDAPV